MTNKKYNIIIFIAIIIILVICLYFIIFHKESKDKEIRKIEVISKYNNPIIPNGFHSVDTEDAKWIKQEDGTIQGWNNGLVIEDEKGNQFVWVPINIDNLNYHDYVGNNSKYIKEKLNMNNDEERQIIKYGGFYIARYEASRPLELEDEMENIDVSSNDIEGIPLSKKDRIPWNYISFEKAQENAEKMYQNENLHSGLLTQKQYQGIMQWLNSSGYDVYENSSQFGNYSNVGFEFSGYYSIDYGKSYQYGKNVEKVRYNMILSTGATKRNMTNNIYDLAGNLMEYVIGDKSNIICNGGYYDYIAREAFSSMGWTGEPSDKIGFRVVLILS